MKKIGIIGSGIVAKTLGAGFLKHGYPVMLGTSDKSKLTEWQKGVGANAQVGSFDETAKFGDIVVLAVKGTAAKKALEGIAGENLAKKTIIDTTIQLPMKYP